MARADADTLPAGVLTGFLGAGKTTLLQRWLRGGERGETAVLINEFGAVGLDHLLVGAVDSDTLLLENGCICCSIRGELDSALVRLHQRRLRGELPPFKRVVIETTGLAAPGPVLATLLASRRFHPAFVATVVDAMSASDQRRRYAEWTAQVAAADTLWLSKTDLAGEDEVAALHAQLARLNPMARRIDLGAPADDAPDGWLAAGADGPAADPAQWLRRVGAAGRGPRGGAAAADGASAFCLSFDGPLRWAVLTLWLTLLMHRHADRILRLKGLLEVIPEGGGPARAVVLHGMGHLMHPPRHLDAWPGADRRSRLVFITRGLDEGAVTKSWRDFEHFYTMAGQDSHSCSR
ncbi:GTP-binding protein [Achromobacter xylosoxidans]|nr:GTP-binding protein [Achromobacter xylosoxidans]